LDRLSENSGRSQALFGIDQLRVLIVSDDPLARAGLTALLADRPECTVAGQVSSGLELPDEVAASQPDVILWDTGWDPAPGPPLDLGSVALPVVALLPDDDLAGELWDTGLKGLLSRDADPDRIAAALQAAAHGLVVIDPALALALLPAREREDQPLLEALTPREEEVLQLLADGLSNKAIALRLGISDHTVKFHVNAILGKLGAQSRTEAVVRATRLGVLIL
jgi:DNA-binding NarL/FixJ family response regulator